jgi:hypothetical protein
MGKDRRDSRQIHQLMERINGKVDLRNKTNVLILAGSIVAYVKSNLVFSRANRFSNPISHAMPAIAIAIAIMVKQSPTTSQCDSLWKRWVE